MVSAAWGARWELSHCHPSRGTQALESSGEHGPARVKNSVSWVPRTCHGLGWGQTSALIPLAQLQDHRDPGAGTLPGHRQLYPGTSLTLMAPCVTPHKGSCFPNLLISALLAGWEMLESTNPHPAGRCLWALFHELRRSLALSCIRGMLWGPAGVS